MGLVAAVVEISNASTRWHNHTGGTSCSFFPHKQNERMGGKILVTLQELRTGKQISLNLCDTKGCAVLFTDDCISCLF